MRRVHPLALAVVVHWFMATVALLTSMACSTAGESMKTPSGSSSVRIEGKPLTPLPPAHEVGDMVVNGSHYYRSRFLFLSDPAWPGRGVPFDDGGHLPEGRLEVKLSLREWESKRTARIEISVTNRTAEEWVLAMDDPHGRRVLNRKKHDEDAERVRPRPSYIVYAIPPYRLGLSWAIEFEERNPKQLCPANWYYFGRGAFDGVLRSLKPGANWTFTTQVLFPPEVEIGPREPDDVLADTLWIRAQLPFTDPASAVKDQASFVRMAKHTSLAVSNWLPVRVPR